MLAPIVVFAYKRKEKLERCLNCLANNELAEESDLFIFLDGAKSIEDMDEVGEVRKYVEEYIVDSIFHKIEVIKREKNIGLANSIILGVTQVISEYGKVIVIEDDILTTKDFLRYMNGALDFYQKYDEYGSISAYTYPLSILNKYNKDVYITRKGDCWGWATWEDRWNIVDWNVSTFQKYIKNRKMRREFDHLEHGLDTMLMNQMKGKIDSWAVRWCYHLFLNHKLTVYPTVSRTYNIGVDGSGTHCKATDIYNAVFSDYNRVCKYEHIPVNYEIEHEAACFEKKSLLCYLSNIVRRELFFTGAE